MDKCKRCIHGDRNLSNTVKLSKCVNKDKCIQGTVNATTSLRTLIVWNISKALENNPDLNIKDAITEAQAKLEALSSADDIQTNVSENPCERHLVCALLAWQELGHQGVDSLYKFVENRLLCNQEHNSSPKTVSTKLEGSSSGLSPNFTKAVSISSQNSYKVGPVVRVPLETKIVMRMENAPPSASRPLQKRPKPKEKEIMKKIDQACCLDSECAERLASLDTMTAELRNRAALLARREAERVELLERAEAAWKDLELGYQRRLALAEEKEQDIARQMQRVIDERNANKNECTSLVQQLNVKSDLAEKDRARLKEVERDVCERACKRMKLSEEAAKGEACLAEQQCRAHQAERDLLFKEEQARRKVTNLQSELDSARSLTYEAERAMREELSALREQIERVSNQLLAEDAHNKQIKDYLKESRKEKMELVEDLEGCKAMCEARMQGKIDELKKKRDKLNELKEKVMECRCKVPIDVTVEVKRTPSLAALCKCTNEDKILESCSCTSLRDRLMTNLLSDLFNGLQSELGTSTVTDMPCQLLKCLEDKHNWDSATVVKTNLNNYFSRLLVGELDIAIATSIEKYHAKWVGESCADTCSRMRPDPGEDATAGWQERAIEQRAQKLATELAEQLFNDRANELAQRAKEIASSGPPPCECKPKVAPTKAAVYSCLTTGKPASAPPPIWRQALQDVTQLRMQIEELKKESIKKEDLKMMETKFAKIIKEAAGLSGQVQPKSDALSKSHEGNEFNNKERKINRAVYYSTTQSIDLNRPINIKKKNLDLSYPNKRAAKANLPSNSGTDKTNKPFKKNTQTYAVNMCLCSATKDQQKVTSDTSKSDDYAWQQTVSKVHQMSSTIRNTKPISSSYVSQDTNIINGSKTSEQQSCLSNCVCFHKKPSNTSIDKLLETLTKWKCDLETTCIAEKNLKSICILNKLADACILDTNHITNVPLNKKDCLEKTNCKMSLRSIDVLKSSVKNLNTLDDINHGDDNKYKNSINVDTQQGNVYKKLDTNSTKSSGPMATKESEYIGAINLDKSIEDFSNCKPVTYLNTKHDVNGSSCSKSSKCDTKGVEAEESQKNVSCSTKEILNSVTDLVRRNKDRMFNDSVLDNDMKTKNKHTEDTYNTISTDSKVKDLKNSITPIAQTCSCDYEIKFLGVTLTDANSKNNESDREPLECIKIKKTTLPNDNILVSKSPEEYEQTQSKTSRKISNKRFSDYDNNENRKINELTSNFKNRKLDENDSKESYNKVKCGICETDQINSIHDKIIPGLCCNDINSRINDNNINNSELTHSDKVKSPETNASNKLYINESKELDKYITPCQCSSKLEEFKNFINISFEKQANDIGLDSQSFKDHKNKNESCVCCHKMNMDESKDLEENAFHLLQEYLKRKVNEFRKASCSSTCIPTEEEQNLIEMILDHVKNLISVSTNQIACKCSDDEGKAHGSWNRAYSLLQEYLKMKIKKVQCTCILTEDNTDTILPGVLEKICNLIEYDFQRLKDVCGCENHLKTQEKNLDLPINNAEAPDKKFDNMLSESGNIPFLNNQSVHHSLINPLTFSTTNHLSKRITSSKTNTDLDNIDILLDKKTGLLSSKTIITAAVSDANVVSTNNSFNENNVQEIYLDSLSNRPNELFIITGSENTNNLVNEQSKKASPKPHLDCVVDSKLIRDVNRSESAEIIKNLNEHNFSAKKLLTNKEQKPLSNCNSVYNLNEINNSEINLANKADKITKKISVPYIGYTVVCSCYNTTLRTCACSNSLTEADNDKINNIMKKSLPDENYFKKVSYILTSRPIKKTSDLDDANDMLTRGDDILQNNTNKNITHGQETSVCCNKEDELVLKKSMADVEKDDELVLNKSMTDVVNTDIITKKSSVPYIGYTVDCSCYNNTSRTCVCSNPLTKADNDKINHIMKISLPDENYFKKLSYILTSRPIKRTSYSDDADDMLRRGDDILQNNTNKNITHEQKTSVCCNKEDELVLKKSMADVGKTNTMINTAEDNLTIDTDYPGNEDVWCECCSNIKPIKNSNSERLKTSIYFSEPLTDYDYNDMNEKMCSNPLNTVHELPNKTCNCDLVPICHVKMLVENIETKLASAKCTCDSLIPEVCPEHKKNNA